MKKTLIVAIVLICGAAAAQDSKPPTKKLPAKKESPAEKPIVDAPVENREVPPEPSPQPSPAPVVYESAPVKKTSAEIRDEKSWALSAQVAPYGTLIPWKYGGSLGYISSRSWTWEFSYMEGSYTLPSYVPDIGKIKESYTGLVARKYAGNSFSFFFGLGYHKFAVTVSDAIVARMPAGSNSDLLAFESLAVTLGVGNRWQFDNGFHLGCDWFSYSQPVLQTSKKTDAADRATNDTDSRNLKDFVNVVRYFPQIMILKVQAGYSF